MAGETYTLTSEDGVILLREDIFATREEAEKAQADWPATATGERTVVVTTEQAHALTAMRGATRSEAERTLERIQRRRTAEIIAGRDPQPAMIIVVSDEVEDDEAPILLGSYVRIEEDAVFYQKPSGRVDYAPSDVCRTVRVEAF